MTTDRMTFFKYMQRRMTVAQWREFEKSDQYLSMKCQLVGYDVNLCKDELRELYRRSTKRNWDVWEIAIAAAHEEIKEPNAEKRGQMVIAEAERQMIDLGYSPPHWTKSADCHHCGMVLVPDHIQSTDLEVCPWCSKWFGTYDRKDLEKQTGVN